MKKPVNTFEWNLSVTLSVIKEAKAKAYEQLNLLETLEARTQEDILNHKLQNISK